MVASWSVTHWGQRRSSDKSLCRRAPDRHFLRNWYLPPRSRQPVDFLLLLPIGALASTFITQKQFDFVTKINYKGVSVIIGPGAQRPSRPKRSAGTAPARPIIQSSISLLNAAAARGVRRRARFGARWQLASIERHIHSQRCRTTPWTRTS